MRCQREARQGHRHCESFEARLGFGLRGLEVLLGRRAGYQMVGRARTVEVDGDFLEAQSSGFICATAA